MNEDKESEEIFIRSAVEKMHQTEGKRDDREEKEDQNCSKKLVNAPDENGQTIVIAEDVKLLRLRMKIFQTMVIYAVYFTAVSFCVKSIYLFSVVILFGSIFLLFFQDSLNYRIFTLLKPHSVYSAYPRLA